MTNQFKRAVCLFSVATVVCVGCSDQEKTGGTTSAQPAVKQAAVTQTAQEATKIVLDGLKASKPVFLWNAMDSNSQKGVNSLIRELAAKIDADVWDRSVRNLKKLVVLLETKKDDFLDSPLWRTTKLVKFEDVKANWKPAVAILKTIVESELVDREKMQKFDAKTFLEGTGATLYAQARVITKLMKDDPLKRFDELKPTFKELSPQYCEVSLQSSKPNDKPLKLGLSVRDGRWTIVQSALLNVTLTLGARSFISRFQPYALVEWKDDYIQTMDRLEKTLDRLQAAKNSEEFQSILSPQVLSLVAQLSRKAKPLTPFDHLSRGREKNTAIVVVKGEHRADEPSVLALSKTLRHLTDESHALFSGPQNYDAKTVYIVGQISDPNALAEKIKVGKIAAVDGKRNIVTVDLPESETHKQASAKDASKGEAADASATDRSPTK